MMLPGHLVILALGAYHSRFTMGYNFANATNFAEYCWIPLVDRCRKTGRLTVHLNNVFFQLKKLWGKKRVKLFHLSNLIVKTIKVLIVPTSRTPIIHQHRGMEGQAQNRRSRKQRLQYR